MAPDRIALQGISQAGYWAPRAEPFEPRRRLVADPGVMNVASSFEEQHLHPGDGRAARQGKKDDFDALMAADPDPRRQGHAGVADNALRPGFAVRHLLAARGMSLDAAT